MIKVIVAYDKNKLIGKNNVMPWHIKEEFEHFKDETMGSALLFGRKTFEGLPKKLNGRKNIVLSTGEVKGADLVIHTEEELMKLFEEYKGQDKDLYISGGKSIYEKYFDFADQLLVSVINGEYDGDTYLE